MLRARHLPYAIGIAERDQWLACMTQAMQSAASTPDLAAGLQQAFRARPTGCATARPDSGSAFSSFAAARRQQHQQRARAAVRAAGLREGDDLARCASQRCTLSLSTGSRPGEPLPLPCTTRTQRWPRRCASRTKAASALARLVAREPVQVELALDRPLAAPQPRRHVGPDAGAAKAQRRRR